MVNIKSWLFLVISFKFTDQNRSEMDVDMEESKIAPLRVPPNNRYVGRKRTYAAIAKQKKPWKKAYMLGGRRFMVAPSAFTKHQDLFLDEKVSSTGFTVSIFGSKNATGPDGTSTIGDVNSDDVLKQYMKTFTHFKVTGCLV